MNSFGRIFRLTIFGESHGPYIGINIDGVPAGIPLCEKDFEQDLKRRNPASAFLTERKETDIPKIISGIFNGKTTGAPLTIIFENKDVDSSFYYKIEDSPRPSHVDFVAKIKYKGFNDFRGSGMFSARLTVALVAAGVIAKKILKDIEIESKVIEVGGEKYPSKEAELILQKAKDEGDTLGGIVETKILNLPIGVGEPFFDGLESYLSHILFSIPSIKAISFGLGIEASKLAGSQYIDILENSNGKTRTNNSGGINGGISNGNDIIFSCFFRPPSSMKKVSETINLKTNEKTFISFEGRFDIAPVLRAPVIVESASAVALVDLIMTKNAIFR